MGLRNVEVKESKPVTRTQELKRVLFQEDGSISAHWVITKKDGTLAQLNVEVSAAGLAQLQARPAFQKIMDDIRDDTFSRTGGQ